MPRSPFFRCFAFLWMTALLAAQPPPVLRSLPPQPNNTVLGNVSGNVAVPAPLTVVNLLSILGGAPASSTTLGVVQCDGFTIICSGTGVISAIGASSGVNSFNGRTGTVASALNDYSFSMLSGNLVLTQLPAILPLTILGNVTGASVAPTALTPANVATILGGGSTPSLVGGSNVTISGIWPNQTVTASSTAATSFSGITGATNTTAAMLVGTGASFGPTGTGTVSANQINGTALSGLATGILKNTTATGVPSIAVAGDFPTLNQSTTGTAALATNLAGGALGSIGYQSAANTTGLLAGNTAATDTVLVSHGTGSVSAIPTFSNAPALTGTNFTGIAFSGLAGSTNTTAALLVGTGASLATTGTGTISATALNGTALSGLATGIVKNTTGTGVPSIAIAGDFPTLNQNTNGNAATATTATNMSGGLLGSIGYQSAVNTSSLLAGNTAATDQVLVSHGTGSVSAAPTFSNAPALSAANMGSFPTLNQSTSGSAASLSAILTPVFGGTGLGTLTPYALLTGGTTALGTLQQVSGVGTSTQVLTSNGPSALPTWQTASSTTTFSAITGSTNTTAAMVVGTGASLGATGSGSIAATTLPAMTTLGDTIYGGSAGALTRLAGQTTSTKNFLVQTGTGTVSAAPAWGLIAVGDVPTLNQSTTGNALTATTATNMSGGLLGSIGYQSAANTTALLAGNTAATDQVLVSHGTGTISAIPTFANAPVLSAANFTGFPTFNQNTSGTAAGLSVTLVPASGGTGLATLTPYAVLTAGTTATGTYQQVSGLGSSTNVLTSNGAGALPTWQAVPGGAFSTLTGGTNTTAAMVVGSGSSLATTGTGTISATALNGTALSGLATGILKNTTGTGVPSIAVAGTDYPGLSSTNSFSGSNSFTTGMTTSTANIGVTGTSTGQIVMKGTTSGSATITVAAASGTPNAIQLPTTTAGATGAVLTSNAASPQVTSWTTSLPVANGGSGLATTTAYGLLAAGTTSTGNFQQVSGTGSSGNVLTSAGASALPTWAAPTFSGLAGSTNTTAAMVVGSGATLGATGTGTITATNFTDFPDKKYIPAANCSGTTPGNGWSLPASTPAVATCFTGTNVIDGYLAFADAQTAQFSLLLPDDWDSASSLDIRLFFTSAATSGTVIFNAATSCTTLTGAETDDQAFNTAQAFNTITLATTNSVGWITTLAGLTKTGCSAGNKLHIKIIRATDTDAAVVNVSGAQLTERRTF